MVSDSWPAPRSMDLHWSHIAGLEIYGIPSPQAPEISDVLGEIRIPLTGFVSDDPFLQHKIKTYG